MKETIDQLADISEERRPGISELARTIAEAHPRWTLMRVMSEAKSRYETRNAKRPNP